jgi:hypothetical protein
MSASSILPRDSKWATLGRVLLFCLSCAITLAITSGLTKALGKPWDSLAGLSAAILATIGLTFLFTRWEGIGLKDIGITPGKYSIARILLGFIIGLLLACLQPLLLMLLSNKIQIVFSPKITVVSVMAALLLYVLIAVREEIAFRAYPLRSLDKAFGPYVALFIIFIVFSLEHILGGMAWEQAFIGAGVGSILFGIAALSTRGLAVPIGLHIAWNFGQWALGFKDNTGIWHAIVDKGYETRVENAGFISYLIIMILGILGFCFYWRKKVKSYKS